MTQWGLPPDAGAWVAFVLGIAGLLVMPLQRQRATALLLRPSTPVFVTVLALASAALSVGYVHFYLGGGPRIIDATSYWLEARLFASGQLSFEPPGPLSSFHGRFLHVTPEGRPSPIFPPGYPLLLALGMTLGIGIWLGPVLAALLTTVTYLLAKAVLRDEGSARLAGAMSAVCAVLRYHTADTMSHGWTAVLLCSALWLGLADGPAPRRYAPWLAGLLVAWAFATRPLSGLVAAGTYALCVGPRQWLRAGFTCTLGVFAFVYHQRVLTGRWGGLAHHDYYATVDGPVGCVRLGFSESIGCRVEHADFIARYMPDGYGLTEALGTTGRRLAMHLRDAGNIELFAPLLLVAAILALRQPRLRLLVFAAVSHVMLYATFYFDGNYPGGGARLFAELIPLEHVLLAWVLSRFGLQSFVLPMMLVGFAVHTSYDHRHLAERDGGRPMYEAERVPDEAELVFVNTDHGFNLGYRPHRWPTVARWRGDGYDYATWLVAGKPSTFIYDFDPSGLRAPTVTPFLPPESWRFEAESNWPARAVRGGWLQPSHSSDPCVSGGRRLRLNATPGQQPAVTTEVWAPEAGSYVVELGGDPELKLQCANGTSIPLEPSPGGGCGALRSKPLQVQRGSNWLVVLGRNGSHFDYLELKSTTPTSPRGAPERANCGQRHAGPWL